MPNAGKTLLRVPGQSRRQIDRARPLGSVETPDRFGRERVHIHRLAAVTPTWRHGQRNADAFALKLGGALRGFADAADCAVGDDDFDRQAASVTDVILD